MLIIYADNKRPKESLLFGQIINIEPLQLIYLFIMRALIGLKEDYCLANMMIIIYANNKRPKGSLLFGQI